MFYLVTPRICITELKLKLIMYMFSQRKWMLQMKEERKPYLVRGTNEGGSFVLIIRVLGGGAELKWRPTPAPRTT